MNIPTLSSSSISSLAAASSVSAASSAQDPDGDDDGQARVHHGGHHRGGAVGSAVMAALQSLGLSVSPSSGSAPQVSDASSLGNSSPVGQDVRKVMHALFKAVRSESASASDASGSASTGAAGAPSPFANGLSALITQVANGSAPSDLQSAFSQLVQDAGSSGAAANASASLQGFLTQLQANLGYAVSGGSGSGNLMTTQA